MAEKALITRRAALVGALTASAALAVPAVGALAADDALTHQLIGAFVSLPIGKRDEALRNMREQGLDQIADAFERTIPLPRPTTLEGLARQFVAEARTIDPTIQAVWIGNDMTPGFRGEIYNITFDRREQKRRKRTA